MEDSIRGGKINVLMYFLIGSLFLLPFTALPYFKSTLREVSGEGAFYLLAPMVVITLFFRLKSTLKKYNKIFFNIWIIYLSYIFFVFVINFHVIENSNYLGKNGVERFAMQYFEFIFGFLVVYSFTSILNNEKKLHTVFNIIPIFATLSILFALFQFVVYTYGGILLNLYKSIAPIIYNKGVAIDTPRVYGFGAEPSHLAFYLSVVMPYFIIKFIQKKRYILLSLLGLVIILTFSRTLYVTSFIEIFIIIYYYKYKYFRLSGLIYYLPLLLFLSVAILYSPLANTLASIFNFKESGSSYTRFIVVYAAMEAFLNHNIFLGLGLGQTGFFSYKYMAGFGSGSPEILKVINHERWPFIHDLNVRLLVETGIIGYTLWCILLFFLVKQIHQIIKEKYLVYDFRDINGYAVITSIIGLVIASFSRENLTNMNIWIGLGLASSYLSVNRKYLRKATLVHDNF